MSLIDVTKISDSLYILNEHISPRTPFTMALVVGRTNAAIIDTGYGASRDLLATIREITDKPILCLLTHCDPDHAGGAALFSDIHMNKDDEVLMKQGALSARSRMMSIRSGLGDNSELITYSRKNMVKEEAFTYKPIENGDIFDLGGRTLEAFAFPGHSKGSMCFWNRKEQYIITGDSIANANSAVLFFNKCLPLREYKLNLQNFIQKTGTDTVIYTGHDTEPLQKQIIPEILVLCDEIIAGNTQSDTPYMPPFLKVPPVPMNSFKRKILAFIMGRVAKKLLGDSIPMEHTKKGFTASIKYNANKI